MVAFCPNSNVVDIYCTEGNPDQPSKWILKYCLAEHDHHVTAIDWAPNSNLILTCSQDRNAYVWHYDQENDIWKPTLVLLRLNRSATCCKWSPDENKFAVGSGAKMVSVCYFEDENKWWVSKMIKKPHKSTILSIAWHPTDNSLLATTCCDFKCRVFNAWIKTTDKDTTKSKFGSLVSEHIAKGWVHSVQFSPSGNTMAYLAHDSTVAFVDRLSDNKEEVVNSFGLPFLTGLFISEKVFVAAGYDFTPVIFAKDESGRWQLIGKLDEGEAKQTRNSHSSSVRDAFTKFQNTSRVGSQNADMESSALKTRHTNTINSIQIFAGTKEKVNIFSTSSLDGRILLWKVDDIQKKFPEINLELQKCFLHFKITKLCFVIIP